MTRHRSRLLVLALLPIVVGCGPQTRPVLIKTDLAIYEAINAIHVTAVTLGQSGAITPAQELRVQQAILPVIRLGEQATRVIAAWKSGPTPPELVRLVQAMSRLVSEVLTTLPGESAAKSALLEKLALAQQTLATILVIVEGAP